jgi:spermidine synthase
VQPHLLVLLFMGSGCAALIYEIVWLQLLELVIGASGVSIGVLLAMFMGGMCLGSFLLPRVVPQHHHPLRIYAVLELAIAALGLVLLFTMPGVGAVYSVRAGSGVLNIFQRAIIAGVCLLPPTLLMGATLPLIARWVKGTPKGIQWVGLFYAGNAVGAVFGCLFAGLYLLRVYDTAVATYVAVAINAAVACIAFGMGTEASGGLGTEASVPSSCTAELATDASVPNAPAVHLAIALSGAAALGGEVTWTRLLSLTLGPTVYTFSIILAVFLLGLGIGSSAGAFAASFFRNARTAFGACQLLLAAAVAWAALAITQSLPSWPINPALAASPWITFQMDFVRSMWAIFPAAVLWGASFPLALASVASPDHDPDRLVGGIYAANTIGAIVGAIAFSMILIPTVGTQQAQRVLIGASAVAGLLVLLTERRRFRNFVLPILCAMAAFLLVRTVPPVPPGVVAYGRQLPSQRTLPKILYVGEGMNASVAVTDWNDAVRNFHVSGKVEASSDPVDMRLERMLGHISALFHPKPRSVLVVGFGAGVTAGSFVLYPDVERIVICEIEPLIPKVVSTYFEKENYGVLKDPRTHVVYDDARHYIRTSGEKFDVITSDPIHPWVKGAATLYTQEYFELAKRRLNPGGIITQWVPLYETTSNVVKSEMATFFKVFPDATVWGNDIDGKGYDVILMARNGPMTIDGDALRERLHRLDYARVAHSLDDAVGSEVDLLATYAGRPSDLQSWLADAEINRDRNLRLQYLAGLSPNFYVAGNIYREIMSFRRFPEDLFRGSESLRDLVRYRLRNEN